MRRNYIRKLYLGEIKPADSCEFETKEYEKASKEFTILYREIHALLPEEKRKDLERMIDAHTAMRDEVAINAFINGFKLGVNLAAESLYSEDN